MAALSDGLLATPVQSVSCRCGVCRACRHRRQVAVSRLLDVLEPETHRQRQRTVQVVNALPLHVRRWRTTSIDMLLDYLKCPRAYGPRGSLCGSTYHVPYWCKRAAACIVTL